MVSSPVFQQTGIHQDLVGKLLQRTGARVYGSYGLRLPNAGEFRAVFRPADVDIYACGLGQSATVLNQTVEEAVRKTLSQYQWEYKRFRRQSDRSELYTRSA